MWYTSDRAPEPVATNVDICETETAKILISTNEEFVLLLCPVGLRLYAPQRTTFNIVSSPLDRPPAHEAHLARLSGVQRISNNTYTSISVSLRDVVLNLRRRVQHSLQRPHSAATCFRPIRRQEK